MKLTTVLPDVFGSLADDVDRNERSWKDVRSCMHMYFIEHIVLLIKVHVYVHVCTHTMYM